MAVSHSSKDQWGSWSDFEILELSSTGVIDWGKSIWTQDIKSYENKFNDDLDGDGSTGRDFSILIKWKSTKSKYDEFKLFLKQFKLNLITGGRFSHICSEHDKGKATKLFIDKTKKFFNNSNIVTVAIGDSKNDFEMLNEVDFPCIVKSPNNHLLHDSLNSKNITFSDHAAPNGWIECIEKVITKIKSSEIANV